MGPPPRSPGKEVKMGDTEMTSVLTSSATSSMHFGRGGGLFAQVPATKTQKRQRELQSGTKDDKSSRCTPELIKACPGLTNLSTNLRHRGLNCWEGTCTRSPIDRSVMTIKHNDLPLCPTPIFHAIHFPSHFPKVQLRWFCYSAKMIPSWSLANDDQDPHDMCRWKR